MMIAQSLCLCSDDQHREDPHFFDLEPSRSDHSDSLIVLFPSSLHASERHLTVRGQVDI
jgi:hypothetical protein